MNQSFTTPDLRRPEVHLAGLLYNVYHRKLGECRPIWGQLINNPDTQNETEAWIAVAVEALRLEQLTTTPS